MLSQGNLCCRRNQWLYWLAQESDQSLDVLGCSRSIELLPDELQPAQQEQALANCFREEWNGAGAKAKRILLPVRHLQQWIEHNVLLLLIQAPFNKRDPQLVPAAGSCVDCPKRTGHNKLLFADVRGNSMPVSYVESGQPQVFSAMPAPGSRYSRITA
jgi:hypothetical protein